MRIQEGTSDMTVRKNSVRKELVSFFKDRDCFILVRPVDDEKKLQNMALVKDNELRPKFLELIHQLRGKVLNNIKKKMFKGKACSPAMFV